MHTSYWQGQAVPKLVRNFAQKIFGFARARNLTKRKPFIE
jgi:hypothetical protein